MPKCIAFKINVNSVALPTRPIMIWLLQTFQNPSPCPPSNIHAPIMLLPPSVAPTSHLYVAPYTLPALCMADSFSLSPSRSQLKCQYLQKAFPTNLSETHMAHPSCPCPITFFISFTHLVHLFTYLTIDLFPNKRPMQT